MKTNILLNENIINRCIVVFGGPKFCSMFSSIQILEWDHCIIYMSLLMTHCCYQQENQPPMVLIKAKQKPQKEKEKEKEKTFIVSSFESNILKGKRY